MTLDDVMEEVWKNAEEMTTDNVDLAAWLDTRFRAAIEAYADAKVAAEREAFTLMVEQERDEWNGDTRGARGARNVCNLLLKAIRARGET